MVDRRLQNPGIAAESQSGEDNRRRSRALGEHALLLPNGGAADGPNVAAAAVEAVAVVLG